MSEPAVDPGPFDLGPSGRDADRAALCLHGLTGTPYEVRPIGEALAAQGVRAFGPVLPGHHDTPEALAQVRYSDWVGTAREALAKLRSEHRQVYVAGLSMGGLLTLLLAADEQVDAAVAVGVPLRLSRTLRWSLPVLRWVMPFPKKVGGPDIRDEAARARHPGYRVMPLAAVQQLIRLQRAVSRALPRIQVPLLVAHGAHDGTANPADAQEIFDTVASETRELLILDSSAHVAPVDHDGEALGRAAAEFLGRYG